MSKTTRGPLMRFLCGIWNGVNFARRLVFNLVFLFIVAIVLIAMFSGGVKLSDRNALVIAPQGQVVEQFSADPTERAMARAFGQSQPETQLRDLLRAIEAAATDARIERLVIRPDQMTGIGYATLQELARAIDAFKKSGKQVVAYADGMDQKQYYLAALADEVYLHPDGAVLLEGLARYRAYFREGLQDKLGANVHLFRVGEFKSAMEPYILDGPSAESLEADLFWMSDVWQRHLADIARFRDLDAAALQAQIDDFAAQVKAVQGPTRAGSEAGRWPDEPGPVSRFDDRTRCGRCRYPQLSPGLAGALPWLPESRDPADRHPSQGGRGGGAG